MFTPPDSRWSVPFDSSFDVRAHPTAPLAVPPAKKELRRQLNEVIRDIDELQYRLFVEDSRSLLLIFQALDAAGKDSTIRAVFRGVNPAGLQVTAFGEPSSLDLDHDFPLDDGRFRGAGDGGQGRYHHQRHYQYQWFFHAIG